MLAYILVFMTMVCALRAIDIDVDIGLAEQLSSQALHEIHVGLADAQLFVPNQINANIGDKIVFIFHGGNHTLTQSSLEAPCLPAAEFDSGFKNFNFHQQDDISLTLTVTSLEPQWFFCKQENPSSHCHAGMVFAINPGDDMASFLRKAKTEESEAISSTLPRASATGSPTAGPPESETQVSTVGLSVVPVEPSLLLSTANDLRTSPSAAPGYSGSSSPVISLVTPTNTSPLHRASSSTIPTSVNTVSGTTTVSTRTRHTSDSTLVDFDTGQDYTTGSAITSSSTKQVTGVTATTVTVTQTVDCSARATAMSVRSAEVVSEGPSKVVGSLLALLGGLTTMVMML
ncbi:hypothetical protein BDV09DRAFT_201247 [Aspergillus tetrazonus]